MFVYAGIDESGYGPMFGPLVIARCIFVLKQHDPTLDPPSLWSLLRSAVCKNPRDKTNRLAINDSKILHKPAWSFKHIERGVLSFLSTASIAPKNLSDLLGQLAFDNSSYQIKQDWYHTPYGDPRIPFFDPPSQSKKTNIRLQKEMLYHSIHLADIKAAVVFEDRFNRMVRTEGSKAGCNWAFVSGHLRAIFERYGEDHPLVIVDRQGGRKKYQALLESAFHPAEVCTLYETPRQSGYRISQGNRQMHILVMVGSENDHFPVALSSMVAKYIRELLMTRFQNFWSARAPHVKPTLGYIQDGRRFLREIQPLIAELNIDPETLIRNC